MALPQPETRDALIGAATRLFAERGFYGVSIAAIAAELKITKQALLHHFGTKEALYGEVLSRLTSVYSATLNAARESDLPPEGKVMAFYGGFCAYAMDGPDDVRLVIRELLDNKERADTAGRWYLREFLNDLTDLMLETPRLQNATEAEARAAAYQLLGAISYFAISEPTLGRIFGAHGLKDMKAAFPLSLEALVMRQIT